MQHYRPGAFAARFGARAEDFRGRALAELIAPAERPALALTLATASLRGRAGPVVLHLADAPATACSFAVLCLPGPATRLCISIGTLPVPAPEPPIGMQARNVLAREAEARMRSGQGGDIGLVEVSGWREAVRKLPVQECAGLFAAIGSSLVDVAGPGAIAAEVSDGRFGVLGLERVDAGALAEAVATILASSRAAHGTHVEGISMNLSQDGLTAPQAVRALRFALGRFADGGAQAIEKADLNNGLAGMIDATHTRARAVRAAIAEGRFQLAYQPVVDLANRATHHYEALLRPIATPSQPFRTTQDFVTFAEAVGLSEELDYAVLAQGVSAMEAAPGASVAVNISGLSFQSTAFRDRMFDHLAGREVGGRLLVELTETAEIEDVGTAIETLERLRGSGIEVCIDDFGAGAAAFRYLREFRVDYVKIDGSYVRSATRSDRDRGFVASMVDLARSMSARVVAEMIETEDEARLMSSLGVEFGQGWLFGKPGRLPGGRRQAA
jgi:EAL domain-containing protein (putative c-di-GMP-specific phosphodiesterase class I)